MWHTVKFSDVSKMSNQVMDEKPKLDPDQENHNVEDNKDDVNQDEQEPEPFKFEDIVPRAPPDNPAPPPPTLTSQVKELNVTFCRQTTAHGWGRVGHAPNEYIRFLWIAISVGALIINIMHVFLLVKQFTKFKSEIKIGFTTMDTDFPAITLCNILPWSMTTTEEFLQNPNTSTYQWHQLTSNLSIFEAYAERLNRTTEFEWVKNRLQQPQAYFENIGKEALMIGHSQLDFIISCTFDMHPCNETNFAIYTTPNFFNCYTFQIHKDLARTTGPNAGLSIVLYLEAYDKGLAFEGTYFTKSNIGNAAGVRVTIHEQDTCPSPIDQGFDIPPGFSANIGLDVSQYKHLDQPWGHCIKDIEKEDRNLFDRFVYSSHDCIKSCQQAYIIEQCQCISSMLPIPNASSMALNYCGAWNVTTVLDLENYLNRILCEANKMTFFMEAMTDSCTCFPPCIHTEHTMDISYSSWPIQYAQPDFFKEAILERPDSTELKAYNNLAKYNKSELVENDLIRSNFARINVFRKSMMVKDNQEKASYDIPQLASDLGGTFGLWIGMSLISWCEVIEFIIKLVKAVCHSARNTII